MAEFNPAQKLYVGNLPYSTASEDLEGLFSEVGTVESSIVMTDRETGRSKGFGFVVMSSPEEAQKAVETFHESDFGGRKLIVNEARPKEDRPREGGSFRPRFGGR